MQAYKFMTKNNCVLGLILSSFSVVCMWLFEGDRSPLYRYFLYHVTLPNLWTRINTIPVIISILVGGIAHQGSTFAFTAFVVIQWFIIGFLVSKLVNKRKAK